MDEVQETRDNAGRATACAFIQRGLVTGWDVGCGVADNELTAATRGMRYWLQRVSSIRRRSSKGSSGQWWQDEALTGPVTF